MAEKKVPKKVVKKAPKKVVKKPIKKAKKTDSMERILVYRGGIISGVAILVILVLIVWGIANFRFNSK